ncbi:hypothetical protein ACHAQA_001333 [Verticillium albo-atrum]
MPKPVAIVVGASRGIGRQVAIDLAIAGYAVVVAAKTTSDAATAVPFPPNPNSSASTINTVEREIREQGHDATAIPVDVRDPDSLQRLVDRTIETYGALDLLLYNSGAAWWAPVAASPHKRFRLLQQVNPEGLYAAVQSALPHLTAAPAGRIVVVSPPIYSRFFRGKTAYAMGKVAMSVLTKGLAMDFAIESAATEKFTKADPSEARDLRKATIFSDAVLAILKAPADVVNGELLLDEDFLRDYAGVTDFSKYSLIEGATPRRIMPAELPDIRVKEQDDEGKRYDSTKSKI